jgi:hypothetical protein
LNPKDQEEVMKRRAKPDPGSLNVFQKVLLVAMVMALFLAIVVSPTMAPILAAGIAGGSLLLFLLLKSRKPKREELNSLPRADFLPPVEETVSQGQEILLAAEELAPFDSPEIFPENKGAAKAKEAPQEKQEEAFHEEAIKAQEPVPSGKDPVKEPQEFIGNEPLVQIQERLLMLEEKTINLEDMLQQLEEKVDDLQKTYSRTDPKIDLQAILSNIEEKQGQRL